MCSSDLGWIKGLEDKCKQFEIVSWGKTKTTPVQLAPQDFPNHKNDSVTSIDVQFRYPAIEPQIKQLAQLLGMDPNKVVMQTQAHQDGLVAEYDKIETENKDLLKDTDYPAPDAEQKALKKDYSADPYDHAVLKNSYRSDFTVAGGKTPPAKTTNDLPTGNASPFSKVKRPPKPATGTHPRG